MLYLRDLRARLQERRNRLYGSDYVSYDAELRYFFDFLDKNPYIRSLLNSLDASDTADLDDWIEKSRVARQLQFPDTEEGRAKICHSILSRCAANDEGDNALEWANMLGIDQKKYNDSLKNFNTTIVDPFVNFLYDRIDNAGNVLYIIERFKLKAEWFMRDELYELYKLDTQRGEALLDRRLRASLFEGGIDYPFSQPSSPSGKADIVALLGSDDPLVLEVKVYDPDLSKDVANLRQGFHQAFRYASDYNESLGYLVIFNCSSNQLVITTDNEPENEFPPRIVHGGKTFFIVTIDVNPERDSASKEDPSGRVTIDSKELTDGVATS